MVKSSKDQIEGHDVHVKRLIKHAEDMLEKGDRLQASEKAWGAFAHQVKIFAKAQGEKSGSHSQMKMLAGKADALAQENLGTKKGEVLGLFDNTENLHTNFYRDIERISDIREKIETTKQLIDILQKLGGDGNGGNGNGGGKPPDPSKSPQMKGAEDLGNGNGGSKPPKLRKPPRLQTGTGRTGGGKHPKPRKSPHMKRAEELKKRAEELEKRYRDLHPEIPFVRPDTPVMTQAQLDRLLP